VSTNVTSAATLESELGWRQWLWAALSFVGWIAATGVTLPIAALVSPGVAVRVDLAIWILLSGAISCVLVAVAGRAAFGAWPRVRVGAFAVAATGVALAASEEILLHEWAEARFGYYDSEMVWWTAGLSELVVATSVASFGVLVAPVRARVAPMLCQAVGVVAVVLVVGSNVEGLADGIRPESVPLAVAVGLCLVYVLVAVAVGWIDRGRRRAAMDSP
jgi:hypothetical protein